MSAGSRELWGKVLIHGIEDAVGRADSSIKSGYLRSASNITAAAAKDRAWIGSRDFREVCELAGLEPSMIERAFHDGRFDKKGWMIDPAQQKRGRKAA